MAKITIEELSGSLIEELSTDTTSTENELDVIYTLIEDIVNKMDNDNEYRYYIVDLLNNNGFEANINMSNSELIGMLDVFKNNTVQGNATINDVLEGKTFMVDTDSLLTGVIPVKSDIVITPGLTDITIDEGFYDNIVIEGDINLVSDNIVSDVSIFNVNGSFQRPDEFVLFENYSSYSQTLDKIELFRITIPVDGNYEVIAKLEILEDSANTVEYIVANVSTNTKILCQSITGGPLTGLDLSSHDVVTLSKNDVLSVIVTKKDRYNGTTGGNSNFLFKITRIY